MIKFGLEQKLSIEVHQLKSTARGDLPLATISLGGKGPFAMDVLPVAAEMQHFRSKLLWRRSSDRTRILPSHIAEAEENEEPTQQAKDSGSFNRTAVWPRSIHVLT